MSRSSRLYVTALLALIPVISLMLVQSAAAQVLAFGTALGFRGDVVTITATLDTKGTQISALGGEIRFDPNAFSARGCSLSTAITQKSLATNLVQPNVERFIVFGLNQSLLPTGILFACKFLILPSGSTLALSVSTLNAADPRGDSVLLAPEPGRIIVLSDSTQPGASRQCNVNTCRSAIASCEISHGCDGLSGGAAASCTKDCRLGVIAACQADRTFSLCH